MISLAQTTRQQLLAGFIGAALAVGAQAALVWRDLSVIAFRVNATSEHLSDITDKLVAISEHQARSSQNLLELDRRVSALEERGRP